MKLYFSTGNIWSWSDSRAKLLDITRKLNVKGVELTFGSKEELLNFKLSKVNEKWLKSLEYVSIHAPFRLIKRYDKEEDIIIQLKKIEEIYKRTNAQNVIIHPGVLPSPKILNKFNMRFSTENMPKNRKVGVDNLKKIFKKYPKLGLCIDVTHSYLWSKYETRKLIENFNNRVTQFHLSATFRGVEHLSLKKASKDFLWSIKPLKTFGAPIIIEEDIRIKSLKYVKDEIKYVKSLFTNVL